MASRRLDVLAVAVVDNATTGHLAPGRNNPETSNASFHTLPFKNYIFCVVGSFKSIFEHQQCSISSYRRINPGLWLIPIRLTCR